jgi:ribosomal protein S18 acetylase RimI-like enzyme
MSNAGLANATRQQPAHTPCSVLRHLFENLLDGEFLIGECDGLLVAMGALKRTSPEERAEIKRMRVHPEYQGRGYGQLMLDELEVRARVLGYQTLHLDTSILQIPAQRLYEKNGFREVGRDSYQGLEVILYEKQLS